MVMIMLIGNDDDNVPCYKRKYYQVFRCAPKWGLANWSSLLLSSGPLGAPYKWNIRKEFVAGERRADDSFRDGTIQEVIK